MTNKTLSSSGDLAFQWMGATKTGSIDSLVEGICWITDSTNSNDAKEWLFSLSSLGHCDLDWKKGVWRITPSRLIRLPNSDGAIAYIGYRRPDWNAVTKNVDAFVEDQAQPQSTKILELPQSIYFLIDLEEQINEVAEALGADYISNAAMNIADSLPSLTSSLSRPSLQPAFDTELEKLEIDEYPRWDKQFSSHSFLRDGIYRVKAGTGKKEFFEKIDDNWHRLDSSAVYFREFARQGRSPFRYVKNPLRPGMGDLFLPKFIYIPIAHLRALTFCSGRIEEKTQTQQSNEVCFTNIPELVFEKVSFALMN